MQHRASFANLSLASDTDTQPAALHLVLVGVDGCLRGYQVHLPPITGHAGKAAKPRAQLCVSRWKTSLPGMHEDGMAACTAPHFVPPSTTTTDRQGHNLLAHPRCTHCRNALLQHELRHQQQDAQATAETSGSAAENDMQMMASDAYLPENWLAVFAPSSTGLCCTEAAACCTTVSKAPAALITGCQGPEEDTGVPLVRRPQWFWWEAPESERLPPVECLEEKQSGQTSGEPARHAQPMNDGVATAMGAWTRLEQAAWNSGSCPWHRLTPLFHHEDVFVELDVVNGVLQNVSGGDGGGIDGDTRPGSDQSSPAKLGARSVNWAHAPTSAEQGELAPAFVPLLLRRHRTKLFCAPPTRLQASNDGDGGATVTRRPCVRAGHTAGGSRVAAELHDTELALPLDLTEREARLAWQISTVVRCAADGVVDIVAAPDGSASWFASPESSVTTPLAAGADPRGGASAMGSYSGRMDELMERVEVEAPTLAAFVVALAHRSDGSTEPLVLPLPVHAAEMEEILMVSSSSTARSCHAEASCGSWSGPSRASTARYDETSTSDTRSPHLSTPGVTVLSTTRRSAPEQMLSGLLLQSEGTPMQLLQGVHGDDMALVTESYSAGDLFSASSGVARRQADTSRGGEGVGLSKTRYRSRLTNDTASKATTEHSSDTSSTTSGSTSGTSSDDDSEDSALESATTASTRVSFLMPTRSESSVWAAPPPFSSDPRSRRRTDSGGGVAASSAPPPSAAAPTSFFDDNFDPVLLLGRGTSGAALLARHRTTGVFYAVKVLLVRDYESEKAILHEVSLHATLQHRNLVRYHSCWSEMVTARRAMQLAFVGLCDPRDALARPSLSPRTSPRGSGGGGAAGLYLRGSSVSDEYLHRGNAALRNGGVARLPQRMRWGSLQLGANQNYGGGARLLIGEDSFSGGSQSSVATSYSPTKSHSKRAAASSSHHKGQTLPRVHNDSNAAVVNVCTSSEDNDDDSGDDEADGENTQSTRRQRKSGHQNHVSHLSLAELDDGEEDGTESLLDGSEYRQGAVIGSRIVFLQMEYCQTTLAHHLVQRNHIDRAENLVILLQLVAGLQYLHQKGVLHRDVKPTNIFVDFRCQLNSAPISPNTSDEDDTDGSATPASAAAEKTNRVDPHCTTLSCLPHSTSLWSMASSVTHRREYSDVEKGSNEDLVQQELREMLNSRHHLSSEDVLQLRRERLNAAGGASPSRGRRSETVSPRAGGSPLTLLASDTTLRKDYRWLMERLVQVRLGDFGLAKPIRQQATFDVHGDGFQSMNNANTVGVGSPVYSSPEQLAGRHCTSASDAYSLGVVMAEMYLMPTTVAERLVTLREVRDGIFPDPALRQRYPELALVKGLTNPVASRRLSLHAVHRQLKNFLVDHLQRTRFTDAEETQSESVLSN